MDVKNQSNLRIQVKALKAGRSLYLFYAPHAVVFVQIFRACWIAFAFAKRNLGSR